MVPYAKQQTFSSFNSASFAAILADCLVGVEGVLLTLAARLEGDFLDGEGLDLALLRAGDFDLPLLRDLDLDLDLDFLPGDFDLAMALSVCNKIFNIAKYSFYGTFGACFSSLNDIIVGLFKG